jgi:hypothetical protein
LTAERFIDNNGFHAYVQLFPLFRLFLLVRFLFSTVHPGERFDARVAETNSRPKAEGGQETIPGFFIASAEVHDERAGDQSSGPLLFREQGER